MRPLLRHSVLLATLMGSAGVAIAQDAVPPAPPMAPDLPRMHTTEHRSFFLSDYVQVEGSRLAPITPKPVFLLFGAHWCEPCHELAGLVHEVLGEEALLLFVHIDDVDLGRGTSFDEIEELTEADAEHLPDGTLVLMHGDQGLLQQWTGSADAMNLPQAAMVLPDGRIVDRMSGFDGQTARTQLEAFLAAIRAAGSGGEPPSP